MQPRAEAALGLREELTLALCDREGDQPVTIVLDGLDDANNGAGAPQQQRERFPLFAAE